MARKTKAPTPKDEHEVIDGPRATVDRAWIQDRMDARGLRGTEVAAALHMVYNVWNRVLTGSRRVQIDEAIKLADVLRAPFVEVVRRLGHELPANKVPIIGLVNGRGRVSMLPPDRQSYIDAPTDSDADTVAIRVEAPHSPLVLYDGNILFYTPSASPRLDAFGRLAVIELADQPAAVVGFLDRASLGSGRIVVYGGIETIETQQLVAATPVRWQRAS